MKLDDIPSAFRELHEAGQIDYWGAPYETLGDEERARRFQSHQALVLWWNVIEWDRTPEQVAAFTGDDYLRPGLIPFAGNGFGDEYCWYPPWQSGSEPPVVLYLHDEVNSRLFAEDFSECLTRCLLQQFGREEPDPGLDDPPLPVPREVLWQAHFGIILPHLRPDHREMLSALGNCPSMEACDEADKVIAARLPDRSLVGAQPPVKYVDTYMTRDELLRAYDESVAFYEEMLHGEGRLEFARHLTEVRANRVSAASG